jgi:2-methylcitrate dehydratase
VCECLYPPGHSFPDKGLDAAVVEAKFRAVSMLTADQAKTIVDLVMSLDVSPRVGPLLDRLRPGSTG